MGQQLCLAIDLGKNPHVCAPRHRHLDRCPLQDTPVLVRRNNAEALYELAGKQLLLGYLYPVDLTRRKREAQGSQHCQMFSVVHNVFLVQYGQSVDYLC